MPTPEMLEQIKALAPEERAKVLDLLLEIEAAQQTDCMDDRHFDQAAERVLDRHADLLRKLAQ